LLRSLTLAAMGRYTSHTIPESPSRTACGDGGEITYTRGAVGSAAQATAPRWDDTHLKAELVSVGTELLLGEIVDTNAAYMSQRLAEIGVDVHFRHTVGDNLARIVSVLELALSRSDAVLICGGLGPTQDDLTRESVAQVSGSALVSDPDAETHLREFFARRGFTPTSNNLKQATVPEGGRLLDNTCGTAPGVLVEHAGKVIFAVPGPPAEMREMMQRQVLPILCERLGEQLRPVFSRVLRMSDIG